MRLPTQPPKLENICTGFLGRLRGHPPDDVPFSYQRRDQGLAAAMVFAVS